MRRCSKCGKEGEDGFIAYAKSKAGKNYYNCNECNTARMRQYRATKAGADAARRAVRKYEVANNKRRRAWKIAKKYSPDIKPCTICQTTINIHKHHPDINKPRYVVYLCALHHKQVHNKIIQIA
jgi:DNA-directed RNA polymerase subunit RPC12/RpoP